MKRFRSLRFTLFFLIALFALNTVVMYAFFDINILKLGQASAIPESAGQPEGSGAVAGAGYNPKWNSGSDTGNVSETDNGATRDPFTPGLGETEAAGKDSEAGKDAELQEAQAAVPDRQDTAEVFLSATQVADLENLALSDKLEALAIISKLDPAECEKIFGMAQDGVTFHELEQIEEDLQKVLTPEEIERLKVMLEKESE